MSKLSAEIFFLNVNLTFMDKLLFINIILTFLVFVFKITASINSPTLFVCVCVCVCVCVSCLVMSSSLQPHRLQSTRPLCPWDSSGKNTGAGCRFLLQEKLQKKVKLLSCLGAVKKLILKSQIHSSLNAYSILKCIIQYL